MAACIQVKSELIQLLVKKIIIVKNATAYTWDWYCHLVVDRASLAVKLLVLMSRPTDISFISQLNGILSY
jgi:hypothetical protein